MIRHEFEIKNRIATMFRGNQLNVRVASKSAISNPSETMTDYAMHNQTLNICAAIFLPLYVIATVTWITLFSMFGLENIIFSWQNYVCFMLLTGVLHVWIYAILKSHQSRKMLGRLFMESRTYHQKILPDFDSLNNPIPWKGECDWLKITIKILYTLLWGFISFIIGLSCIKLNFFGIGQPDTNALTSAIAMLITLLLVGGMVLNYFSYFSSICFCFFTREIANTDDITCDSYLPWNSVYLRRLIEVASRNSMSFFAVSSMYMLALAVNIFSIEVPEESIKYWILLLALSIFLCSISFLIFTLLPKIFLNRRFRKWKFSKVEEMLKMVPVDEKRIEKIFNSNLPYVRMEAISGIVALALDFASLIACILTLIK